LDAGGAAAAAARAAAERQWQSVMLATYLNLKETS
jgi:hypothetical protein